MASDIEVRADAEGVSRADVREALDAARDGVSPPSPVSPGFPEVAVVARDDSVVVRVQGHDGTWSQETEATLTQVLAGVDGVDPTTVEVVEGGADVPDADEQPSPDTDDADADDADDAATDYGTAIDADAPVTVIDGIGPGRQETLASAGITTVGDVREAGLDGLVDAGIPGGVAETLVARARV